MVRYYLERSSERDGSVPRTVVEGWYAERTGRPRWQVVGSVLGLVEMAIDLVAVVGRPPAAYSVSNSISVAQVRATVG